jgi:YebC/PmpR family DNA-binding regulatory protein
MAGHSKWANIKHKKARTDAKRGKAWSKCSKAIMVAAKEGGGDVNANLSLRYAVEEAKAVNMPKDTIERAIKKGAGETGGADYVAVRYEGYGPAGVAVIVDTLTDNRNRTAPEMRTLFTKSGGNLGATGCVGYMFEPKGVLLVEAEKTSEEQIMELAIDAGAEDVELEDGIWTVTTEVSDFIAVKETIDGAGIETTSAELTMLPNITTEATGADVGKVIRLIDNIEDHDDVQKVYTNLDASEEDLAAAVT